MEIEVAATLVGGAIVLGGIGLIAVLLRGHQRLRELAVQERIAMIERGLVPPPEADPAAFDRLLNSRRPVSRTGARFRSAGLMIMGVGAAMTILLAFVPRLPLLGFGVGGAITVIGLTAFLQGWLLSADTPDAPRT